MSRNVRIICASRCDHSPQVMKYGRNSAGLSLDFAVGPSELQRSAVAVGLAPGVSNDTAAFSTLRETILDPVA